MVALWWPYVGRAQVVYIGLLPETVCMPCSGNIQAVYWPYTSGQCPSSGRIQAAADLLGNYPKICIQSTQEGVANS